MMQTLFSMEHNSIAAMLAAAHPEFGDETLFAKARLITCALIAKIHTVEWTPAVTPTHGRRRAVRELVGPGGPETAQVRRDDLQERGTARHSRHRHRGLRRAVRLTEEFVAVYRMHPLVPDDFDFRSVRDDAPTLGPRSFSELTGPQAVPILRDQP